MELEILDVGVGHLVPIAYFSNLGEAYHVSL